MNHRELAPSPNSYKINEYSWMSQSRINTTITKNNSLIRLDDRLFGDQICRPILVHVLCEIGETDISVVIYFVELKGQKKSIFNFKI